MAITSTRAMVTGTRSSGSGTRPHVAGSTTTAIRRARSADAAPIGRIRPVGVAARVLLPTATAAAADQGVAHTRSRCVATGAKLSPFDGGMAMATGWAGDGAIQDQIDATVKDAIRRARSRLPQGPGLE